MLKGYRNSSSRAQPLPLGLRESTQGESKSKRPPAPPPSPPHLPPLFVRSLARVPDLVGQCAAVTQSTVEKSLKGHTDGTY